MNCLVNPHRMLSWAALLTLLWCCGCGKSASSVKGSITYDGQPLDYGMVSLRTAEGKIVSGAIHNGQYQLPEVPPGPAKMSVQTFAPPVDTVMVNPADAAEVAAASDAPFPAAAQSLAIPDRYRDYETSGLTLDVKPGQQTKDLALTP